MKIDNTNNKKNEIESLNDKIKKYEDRLAKSQLETLETKMQLNDLKLEKMELEYDSEIDKDIMYSNFKKYLEKKSDKEIENMFDTIVPSNLKQYRQLKDFTQTELANSINKSLSTIQKYEKGDVKISVNTLIDICFELCIDPCLMVDNSFLEDVYISDDVFKLLQMTYIDYEGDEIYQLIENLDSWNLYDSPSDFFNDFIPNYEVYEEIYDYYLPLSEKGFYSWIFTDCYFASVPFNESDLRLSKDDFKYLLDNDVLIHEDPKKLLNKGISIENQRIIHKYIYRYKSNNSSINTKENTLEIDIKSLPDEGVKEIKDFINYIYFKYSDR